ncbi:MAG: hypothetical protein HZA93_24045 [Verrucomicrobia bacterium]|nr:hypothetical protein [Verrucomicrobiota bacterium]
MKPIDYRNATFAQVRATISGQREAVWQAWCQHGPCTTEDLAARAGISILNVRPRTTELVEMGFVLLVPGPAPRGGVYRAATPTEAADQFHRRQVAALNPQTELSLT